MNQKSDSKRYKFALTAEFSTVYENGCVQTLPATSKLIFRQRRQSCTYNCFQRTDQKFDGKKSNME